MSYRLMRRFLQKVLILFLGVLAACSGSSSPAPESSSLIIITDSFLKANSSHLSGTLAVYPENGSSRVTHVNLLFAEDGNGDITVSSPAVKLKKSTVYRFVIIFYWDDIPFAYVDTIQVTSTDSATQLSYSESIIVYTTSTNNPDIATSISGGILPNLDSDEDGYSNFEELKAGTDIDDPESTPDGPAIIWNNLTAGKSVAGTIEINIDAIDNKDGVSSVELINPSNISNISTLPEKFVGNWNTTSLADGDFPLIARATDTKGNVSESQLIVNISNKVDRSGPEIRMSVFKDSSRMSEFDLANEESLHDVVWIEVTATDEATGVESLTFFNKSDFPSAVEVVGSSKNYLLFNLDTTTFGDEANPNLIFTSTDEGGRISTKTFSLKIKNIPTILDFKINGVDVSQPIMLSALHDIRVSWNGIFLEKVQLQRGILCNKTSTEVLLDRTEPSFDRNFSLTSQYGSGPYVFCAYRTGKNLAGEDVPFSTGLPVTINWDDDEDGFKNEDDCGPLNKLAFPGNTRAYLMDDDYNCDGDSENIDLGDATYSFTGIDSDEAGYVLNYAGDINGDNCSDILIATKGNDARKPLVYLIYGFGGNCLGHPDKKNIDFDLQSIAADSGAVFIGEQLEHSGAALQGVGDLDEDGCDDFLIGAPLYNAPAKQDAGRVYLVYGKGIGCNSTEHSGLNNLANVSVSIRGSVFTGSNAGDMVGSSVAGLGNVAGVDKKLDFGFGATGVDTLAPFSFSNAGAVYIFTGSLSTLYGGLAGENLGSSLNYGGRFNQDEYDDILVGSPGYLLEGKVSIIPGAAILTYTTTSSFDYSLGQGPNADFPNSLSYMGDTNKDGYDDFVGGDATGSIDGNQHVGGIEVVLGKRDSRVGTADFISAGPLYPTTLLADQFGKSVASGADINPGLNSDLFDLMIGSPGVLNKGTVSLWMLQDRSFIGITDTEFDEIVTLHSFLGENTGDNAGAQVSLYGGIKFDDASKTSTSPIAGDFNGDNCADPIIGAPGYGNNQGKVYVMLSGYCPQP